MTDVQGVDTATNDILRTIRDAEPSLDVMYDVVARLLVATFLKTRFSNGRMKAFDDFVVIVREQIEYEVSQGFSAGGNP